MVLRLACARLHPPPRPPKGFYTHDIPTPPDGPAWGTSRAGPSVEQAHRVSGPNGGRGRRPRRPAPSAPSGRSTRSARKHGDTESGFEAGLRAASSATSSAKRVLHARHPHASRRPGAGRPIANGHPQPGIKQPMTDVRVKQLSTSSVPSCLRALRVDRPEAFKQDYYAVKSHFARRGRVARPPTGQHGARGDTGTRRWF